MTKNMKSFQTKRKLRRL